MIDEALLARVGAFVARERLLAPRQPVLALASGGADSTLLVHALVRLGYEVSVLHVAHALRGAESEADAAAVAALADELGVPLHAGRRAAVDGPDLERRARDLRRAAADELAAGRPIATGHTRDDRIETILYRLASSPGAAAFRALPAERRRRSRATAARARARRGARGARRRRHRLARRRRERRSPVRARARAARPAARVPQPASRQPTRTCCARRRSSSTSPACSTTRQPRCSSRTAPRSTRTPRRPRRPSSRARRCAVSPGLRRRRPPASSARSSCATGVRARAACRSAAGASPSAATASCA